MEIKNNNSDISLYRPEIDGLRAFSIIAVIIYHFNKNILPGGYLGVDVFFVISGFVITSSLYRRKNKNFSEFLFGFFERRIKRLIPLLFIYVLLIGTFICFFNPEPIVSIRTGVTSLFGISNLYLLKQSTDYFASSTDLNPFTQTWSLAVEEQFYIFFPFFIWLTGFNNKKKNSENFLFILLIFLSTLSLIYFINIYQINKSVAYFLMPTRFWEIASGCLSFLIIYKLKFKLNKNISCLSFLSIIIILICMRFNSGFGIISTLSVVIFSNIFLFTINKNNKLYLLLSHPISVYIGSLSYSLYLWHWGVYSLSRWTIGVHWWSIPFQIILFLILSIFSYKFIEGPLRKSIWDNKKSITILYGISSSILLSIYLLSLELFLFDKIYLGKKGNLSSPVPTTISGRNLRGICDSNIKENNLIIEDCWFVKDSENNTIWLLGDSHAEASLKKISKIAKDLNFNLFLYFFNATAFPSTDFLRTDIADNLIKNNEKFDEIEEILFKNAKAGDVITIIMRHPYHFGNDWYDYFLNEFAVLDKNGNYSRPKSKSYNYELWNNKIIDLAKKAKKLKVNILLFNPTPEFPELNRKECLGYDDQWFNKLSKKSCDYEIDRAIFLNKKNGIYKDINKNLYLLEKNNSNIFVFDSFNAICDESKCRSLYKGQLLFKDDDHISDLGYMSRIYPPLLKFFKKNFSDHKF